MGSNSVASQLSNPGGFLAGSNSFVGQVGSVASLPSLVMTGANAISSALNPPSSPSLQSPADATTGTPTLAQTNTTALQTQLSNEHQAANTSTILTGGQGLLDKPVTTSSVLLGN